MQKTILSSLIDNEDFAKKAVPHIKPEYFDLPYQPLYNTLLTFFEKYKKLPTRSILKIELEKNKDRLTPDQASSITEVLDLKTDAKDNLEWISNTAEKWCKDRAIHLSIMESINIIDGNVPDKSEGMIPDLLTQALAISFDTKIGHDYIEDATSRYDYYHNVEERLPFDIEKFNEITNGGVPRKTLNMITAGTNVGKSLIMCHMAAANLTMGQNVLYITMEMSEEAIAQRIDANLFDTEMDDIAGLSKADFDSKIGKIQSKTNGRLQIKEFPTAGAHTGHFRALLNELALKKGFIPKVIYIDYVNICASSRMKGMGSGVGSYGYIKSIAEEIRGLGVEFNVPIWSATQLNREGFSNSDADITDVAESFGLPATCDFMIVVTTNDKLDAAGQFNVKLVKSRYGNKSNNKRFLIGVESAKMRLFDLDDPMAGIASEQPIVSEVTPFSKGRPDTSNFKT